uniref:Glycosyltransferase n=1 Tax=viral metagenome TaxID=1070528 RepID=A0A6C0EU63_9ZZZZ
MCKIYIMNNYLEIIGIVLIIIILIYYIKNNSWIIKKIQYFVEKTTIPKIIIQTWKDNNIPAKYNAMIDSIKKMNTDYKYMFFTDDDIETFLKGHYPEYYKTYLKLPIKIQKIDFFRYIVIYHYGGFYMDLDMNGIQNFDDLLNYKCVFPVDEIIQKKMCINKRYKPFCDRNQYFLLGQYAFAAEPRNQFIKLLIDTIHENIDKYVNNVNNSELYVYRTTGPDYVTNLYLDYENKDDIKILHNNKRQYFGDYAKHNYFGSWKT